MGSDFISLFYNLQPGITVTFSPETHTAFRASVCATAFLSPKKVNGKWMTASELYDLKPLPNPGG